MNVARALLIGTLLASSLFAADDAVTAPPVIQGQPAAVTVDAQGNRFVIGTFSGSVDFNPGVGADIRNSTGFSDLFVTRFNADGSYGWTQTFGNNGFNSAAALLVGSNAIYVAGSLTNFDFHFLPPEPLVPLDTAAINAINAGNAGNAGNVTLPIKFTPPPTSPPSPLFANIAANVSTAYVLALDPATGNSLTTFGSGGIVTYPSNDGAQGRALALSGNSLYLGGAANFSSPPNTAGSVVNSNSVPIVISYAADSGAVVTTFGTNGVFAYSAAGSINGLVVSAATLYAVGTLGSPFDFGVSVSNSGGPLEQALILSLDAAKGTLDAGFGNGGVKLFGDAVDQLTTGNAIAISGTTLYITGGIGPNAPAQPIVVAGNGATPAVRDASTPAPVKAYAAAFDALSGAAKSGFGTLGVATFGRQFDSVGNAILSINNTVYVAGDYGGSYELGGFPIFFANAGGGPKGGVFAAATGAGVSTANVGRRPTTPSTASGTNSAPTTNNSGAVKGLVFRPQANKVTGVVQATGPAAKGGKKGKAPKKTKKTTGITGATTNIPAKGASSTNFAQPIFFGGTGSFVDAFVLALDGTSGQPLTTFSGDGFETFGGSLDDHGNGLAYFNGKLYLTGDFYSTDAGVGGLGTIDSTNWNGYLLQLDATTGGGGGVETNRAPVVSAGPNHEVRVPEFNDPDNGPNFPMYDFLEGSVDDDGLPNPPGTATAQWAQVSGPAPAMLDSPTQVSTSVTYPVAGQYVFSLSASDSALSASSSVTVNVSVNHAPDVLSPPTATPSHPAAGQAVTFSIAASDKDNDPLYYTWDFGDGNFDYDASVVHTYDSGGKYLVIVDVDDGWDIVERSFVLQVSDGVPGTLPIEIDKLSFKVNFGKSSRGKDSCEVGGSLGALASNFTAAGAVVSLDLNGVSNSFILDANGSAKTASGSLTLVHKGNAWLFEAKVQGSFASMWGLFNETDSSAYYVMPVTLTVNGTDYSTSKSVRYTSMANRGGVGK